MTKLSNRFKNTLSFLKFWCTSNNAHGIHSPFVFKLVTDCFYSKKKINSVNKLDLKKPNFKSGKLICKILDYFNFNEIKTSFAKDFNIVTAFKESNLEIIELNKINSKILPKTFIYIDKLTEENYKIIADQLLKNPIEFVIIIRNIHENKATFMAWNSLKNKLQITVSIDTYNHGILIHRFGQVKEDFKIRF